MTQAWTQFSRLVRRVNSLLAYLSAFLIITCTLVLCYEVLTRYVIQVSNDWVIEMCIFMLIGATFLAAGRTQMDRAHVGIELLDEMLAPNAKRWRVLFGDVLSFLFCAFIAVLSWEFFYEAYAEGWDSGSTWAPKLWVPYSLMAAGLTTLSLEFLIQVVEGVKGHPPAISTKASAAIEE